LNVAVFFISIQFDSIVGNLRWAVYGSFSIGFVSTGFQKFIRFRIIFIDSNGIWRWVEQAQLRVFVIFVFDFYVKENRQKKKDFVITQIDDGQKRDPFLGGSRLKISCGLGGLANVQVVVTGVSRMICLATELWLDHHVWRLSTAWMFNAMCRDGWVMWVFSLFG